MENQPSREDQFLAIIDQIIEANIGNEDFSVEDLAQEAGLSRSMLHRKLNKLTGKSASLRITEKRLKLARNLLENDVATVSEIAYRVGFSDPSYFNKVFKKHYQVSPGNVRKSLTADQHEPFTEQDPEIPVSSKPEGNRSSIKVALFLVIIIISGGVLFYIIRDLKPTDVSIAVLPFHNLTGQAENDYFVDGMHDALIGELGQIGVPRVISRTSTLAYRHSEMLLSEIAKELGVNTIVEASVMAIGDSIKFLIQLIDVFPEERHLLKNEYYDAMQNVVKIQTVAVKDIAEKIRIRLSENEEQVIAKTRTINPETYQAYLRGIYLISQGTSASTEKGLAFLEEAIKKDPGDPFAYAGFALGKAIQGHGMIASQEAFRSAKAAAEKALIIDPPNDKAHTALALLYLYQYWDWPKAQEAFKKAISLNPNNEIAHAHYAWYHVLMGDMKQSIFHAKRAVELDPLSASFQSWLAWLHYHNEDYDQAEFWARESLEQSPDIPWADMVLGWTFLKNKQFAEAIEAHERLPNKTARWLWFRCHTYVLAGERENAISIRNELEELSKNQWVNPFYMGMIAGVLGDTDRAFELINEALDNKYFPLTYMDVFPSSDFIKNDPRYKALLQKMNLPIDRTLLTAK